MEKCACIIFLLLKILISIASAIVHSILKGGYRKIFYSFISLVGHNIWWENSRNGPFGPKNDPKTQIWPFLRSFLGSKFGTIPSGGGPEFGTSKYQYLASKYRYLASIY